MTIWSVTLHQSWSRTPDPAISLIQCVGLRKHVAGWVGAWGSADFESCERLESASAGGDREVVVAAVEVGHRVEGDSAGEQLRVLPEQEECFLSAHAAAECVDPALVDPEPRQRSAGDLVHPGEVGDLAPVAPGVKREPPSHPSRADHRESAAVGQLTPESSVHGGGHTAPVW